MRPARSARLLTALATGVLALGLTTGPLAASAGAQAAHRYTEYVALGDSFSADVFTALPPVTKGVPIGCAQSRTDYPHQVAAALKVRTFRDATCGSATTEHMTKSQSVPLGGPNAPQFSRLTKKTDLVTLGIGGNDIGLVGIAESCLSLSPTGSATSGCKAKYTAGGVDKVTKGIAAAAKKITKVVKGIRARSPKARVVLVNYLDAVPLDGSACWGLVAPITKTDMTWFAKKFQQMNAMIAGVAKKTHADLADTFTPTIGHDVCKAPGKRYVEGLVPLSISNPLLLAFPFHPNQAGANAQAKAVLAEIRR